VALQQVDAALRQAVLDEWAALQQPWHPQPAGYLFGIIQRAIRGEFNAWARKTPPRHPRQTNGHHPHRRPNAG
jgi:hypothetical protein